MDANPARAEAAVPLPEQDVQAVADENARGPDVWDRHGPIDILLIGVDAGLDAGCRESSYKLSDTIILVRFDPNTKRAGLMTIPRDLFVYVRGYGGRKITTAHAIGENQGKGEGPELLKETIQDNLEVPVHRYVKVDLDGFERIIDELGGIDITVPASAGNPEVGLYDPNYPDGKCGTLVVDVKPGRQHMNGAEALQYARSRKTTSDFDRSRRQIDVLMAIRRKMLSPRVLANAPGLVPALTSSVETDFTAREIGALSLSAMDVDTENIQRYPIDANVVYDDSVLVDNVVQAVLHLQPNVYADVRARFLKLERSPTPTPTPTTAATPGAPTS
jgi:LCP family protein required for cell wall assembly